MKLRSFISFILVSALLVGCGKETRDEVPSGSLPISFSAGVSAMARGIKPEDPSVLISVGNQASIFATRIVSDVPEDVFTNRKLICESVTDYANSVWDYSPVEYWKNDGDYYFSAVFPYSNDAIHIDNAYRLNVSYSAGHNTDLMVARAYRDAAVSKDPVNLVFKHTTSAVRFLFAKSSENPSDQYKLTSFQLEDLIANGEFSLLTRVSGAPTIDQSNWSVSSGHTTLFDWEAETSADQKSIPYTASADNPDGYLPMGWYYMVPQALSANAAVRFSVSYNDGAPVETVLPIYGALDQNSESGTSWLPNCVYNYFITLNQSGLDLTVKTVPWDEVEVTTDDFDFE